jgi:hypothetical protein
MKKLFLLFVLIMFWANCYAQKDNKIPLSEYDSMEYKTMIKELKKREELQYFKNKDLKVEVSENWLPFKKDSIAIPFPINIQNYPISYSFIYENKLIALFDDGSFSCFSLDNFQHDLAFEQKLNEDNKKFKYALLIENQIIGLFRNKYFAYNKEKGWVKYKNQIPIKKSPKLFEDRDFLVFSICHGEWGGIIFFYNKITKLTTFTEATCANSVIKTDSSYLITSSLGHMMGSFDIKNIKNPEKLPFLRKRLDTKHMEILNELQRDTLRINKEKLFDYWSIMLFSSFIWNKEYLHIAYYEDMTFLAKVEKNKISIINSIWYNDFYTHNPITTQYEKDFILINLDEFIYLEDSDKEENRETGLFLIKDNKLLKITWTKNN